MRDMHIIIIKCSKERNNGKEVISCGENGGGGAESEDYQPAMLMR